MDAETGRALLGGFIAGAAAALATTVIALRVLLRSPAWRRRASAPRLPAALLGVVAANGLLLVWTATGLVLGAAYLRAESERPAGGLGSPNRLFTLAVLAVVGSLLGLGAVARGRVTTAMVQTAAIAALAFGWALPLLAAAG
jgi:hypothetical protein